VTTPGEAIVMVTVSVYCVNELLVTAESTFGLVSKTSSIQIRIREAVSSTNALSDVEKMNFRNRAALLEADAPMYPNPGLNDIGPSIREIMLSMVSADNANLC
jgi:hypothetical protein